jgi:hypothetical protein
MLVVQEESQLKSHSLSFSIELQRYFLVISQWHRHKTDHKELKPIPAQRKSLIMMTFFCGPVLTWVLLQSVQALCRDFSRGVGVALNILLCFYLKVI